MIGYTGPKCEIIINSCSSTPCLNGATCQRISPIGYNCMCSNSFTGVNCEVKIDSCASNPCSNNGKCVQVTSGYTCQCNSGYTGVKFRS